MQTYNHCIVPNFTELCTCTTFWLTLPLLKLLLDMATLVRMTLASYKLAVSLPSWIKDLLYPLGKVSALVKPQNCLGFTQALTFPTGYNGSLGRDRTYTDTLLARALTLQTMGF